MPLLRPFNTQMSIWSNDSKISRSSFQTCHLTPAAMRNNLSSGLKRCCNNWRSSREMQSDLWRTPGWARHTSLSRPAGGSVFFPARSLQLPSCVNWHQCVLTWTCFCFLVCWFQRLRNETSQKKQWWLMNVPPFGISGHAREPFSHTNKSLCCCEETEFIYSKCPSAPKKSI